MNEAHIKLIEDLFILEGLRYEKIDDPNIVMPLTKGKCKPGDAIIRPISYPDWFLDIYEAVDFINKNGLRRC